MYEGILVNPLVQSKKSPMDDRNEGILVNPLAQSRKSPMSNRIQQQKYGRYLIQHHMPPLAA